MGSNKIAAQTTVDLDNLAPFLCDHDLGMKTTIVQLQSFYPFTGDVE